VGVDSNTSTGSIGSEVSRLQDARHRRLREGGLGRALCVLLLFAFVASPALADLELADGRLTLDALVSANAKWLRSERHGMAVSRFDFYRFEAPVGLTAAVGEKASIRLSFDAGFNRGVHDLYVDLRWPGGIGFKAGQFLLPAGSEAIARPRDAVFVERSIVWLNWRPWSARDLDVWDPRDAGAMLTYESGRFDAAVAVVNGSGKTVWLRDDNDWKDVCGRLVVRPIPGVEAFLAARGYYGRIGTEGTAFRNLAGEFRLEFDRFRIAGEGQHAVAGTATRTTCYLQGAYAAHPLLEPVFRVDASLKTNDTDLGFTPGLNISPAGDRFRLMLNYTWRRRISSDPDLRSAEQRLLAQIQAWL